MLLILVSVLTSVGAAVSLLAVVIVLRGYRVFLSHMLMVLYRIAIGEVAAIELIDDEE